VLAVLLTISIFGYLWLVGASIGFACVRRRWLLQTLLLAPSIGFSAVITTIVSANYLGLPIEDLAVPLVLIFGVLSVVSLWVFRPTFPWRQYAPYAAILAVAFLLNSIPFVLFGFNWVSFSNGDATTYALNAYRLMHYGYWSLPPASDLLLNSIPSSLMYYHYCQFPGGFYHGFDVVLATVSQLTGLNPYQVYMPVMGAGLVSLTSATGTLLLYRGVPRSAPIVACLAAGFSSQATLGYVYQLGPQELGLTMFVASIALLTNASAYALEGWALIGYAALAGLALAGLNTTYSAFHFVLPPVLLAFLILRVVRREIRWMDALRLTAVVVLFTGVFTNVNSEAVKSSVLFGLSFGSGRQMLSANAFPFYLVPSGLANFWGLYPMAHPPAEPLLSLGLALGGLLLLSAVLAAFWLAWRGAAIAAAVMFGMFSIAALTQNGFALFKLSMYIEPFLWATASAACFTFIRAFPAWQTCTRRQQLALAASPLVLLGVVALNAQQFYISRSEDPPGSGDQSFVALPHASSTGLLSQLRDIRRNLDSEAVVMDTDSPSLGAYEGFYLYGRPNFEPSLPRIKLDQAYVKYVGNNAALGLIRWDPRAAENLARMGGLFTNTPFALEPHRPKGTIDAFEWYRIHDVLPARSEPTMILTTTSRQTVLNRSHAQDQRSDAVLMPRERISNHLILLNATLGSNEGNALNRNAALYRVQDDFFNGGQTFSGVGRYLLFYIINPTKSFRFVLDLTASLNADGVNALPPAAAVGSNRVRFDSVGRGSARLFSPPLSPQMLRGNAYAAIDMGKDGSRYPNRKTGLMRLYGLNYGGDLRRIVGFARNISAISEDEYRSKVEPPVLASFPRDVNNEALEYSGIYDDGWVSKTSYAILRARGRSHVDVAGVVPEINDPGFRTEVRVRVDGQEIDHESLGPGAFALSAGDIAPGRHRLSVQFSREQALPHGDRRLVVGLLSRYGFTRGKAETGFLGAAALPANDIHVPRQIKLGPEWGVPEHYAGQVFRWCAGQVTLHVGTAIRGVTLTLEPGPAVPQLPMHFDVSDDQGRPVAALSISRYERVTIPLPKGHSTVLRLRVDNGGSHIASDPRILDFRVFSVNAN
jgi:hypothetical protein